MARFTWLVDRRRRHLKWPALDPIEALLMILSCLCIVGFTTSVFLDVLTRELRMPWLWLQQVTTGFFTYGIFIGMALAARRNEHMYLAEITERLTGRKRAALEALSRIVVLFVALMILWFGIENVRNDMGSFRMPSLIPLGYYSMAIPISGALIALFMVEQLVNGARNGFADHELEAGYE